MARSVAIPLFCCLLAAWACQVALASRDIIVQTRHGLVLPTSRPATAAADSDRQELEVLRSLITAADEQQQPQQDVLDLAASAALASALADDAMHMEVTVSTSKPAGFLPSWLHGSSSSNNKPSLFGLLGRQAAAMDAQRQQLAAIISESVRRSAESYISNSNGEEVVILDMTVDGDPKDIIAAATAGAATAAASAASSGQPFEGLELQLDVTQESPLLRGWSCLLFMVLLSLQLLLCVAMALLWGKETQEGDLEAADAGVEPDDNDVYVALKQHKDQRQQGSCAAAEEGRGLYEKLLP